MRASKAIRSIGVTAMAITAAWSPQACAQSSVDIYGLIGVYVGSMQRSNAQDRVTQEGHGGLTTSYLGFRGKEDIGGGVKVIFQLENFFQPDTGAAGRSSTDPTGFSRSAWIGLEGGLGRLSAGRHTTQYYLALQSVNPFVASTVFSPLIVHSYVAGYGGVLSGDSVWDNTLQYASPVIGGFSVSLQHGFGEVAGDSSVDNNGLHVRYARGPLSATFAAQKVKVQKLAPSTSQTAYLAGGTYDFGAVKLFASAQKTERNVSDIETRTYQAGVSVPATAAGKVLASWARTKVTNPLRPDTERDTATVGYDHALSKRTDVYALYLYDKLTANPNGKTYAVGIRHIF